MLALASPVWAYHFPWDQGHDTFTPQGPDGPNNPPDNGNNDDDGDPVEVRTGNFFFNRTRHDIRLLDQGPALELLFAYHSQDYYSGPFGRGWHSTLTSMAIHVTDGADQYIIIRNGEGRRHRYKLNADGSFQNPSGVYERLTKNPDGTYTLRFKGGLRHEYNAAGRLTAMVAVDQQAVRIAYDDAGAILAATNAAGRFLVFGKGPNGKVQSISDPFGGSYTFDYDTPGTLVRVVDSRGNTNAYVYDTSSRMTQIIGPDGTADLVNKYDSANRVTSQTFPEGTANFYYDSATQTRVQDPIGGTVVHQFNANGLPTTTSGSGLQIVRTWDAGLNLVSVTNPDGSKVDLQYDANGNITQWSRGGQVVQLGYDPAYFRLISVASQTNSTPVTISYDDTQGSIQIQDESGVVRGFTADSFGLFESPVRALGVVFPYTARYRLQP